MNGDKLFSMCSILDKLIEKKERSWNSCTIYKYFSYTVIFFLFISLFLFKSIYKILYNTCFFPQSNIVKINILVLKNVIDFVGFAVDFEVKMGKQNVEGFAKYPTKNSTDVEKY